MAKWVVERRKDGLVAVRHKIRPVVGGQDYHIAECGAEALAETDSVLDWVAKEAIPGDLVYLDGELHGVVQACDRSCN